MENSQMPNNNLIKPEPFLKQGNDPGQRIDFNYSGSFTLSKAMADDLLDKNAEMISMLSNPNACTDAPTFIRTCARIQQNLLFLSRMADKIP
ncbi:hypothetical protein BdWA1_000912 [Babesia duncani]|uniref:Uncharacterized protein n=1 Tax=Babesia duncani TaxID=323732 RepID=A0AAD9PN16_9APIC|nr:hypothetical protein BdWA1_003715 [Babesia duncani]KAK2197909.1 hypothetical protein BdWA1_000912 [Babesia duncani]